MSNQALAEALHSPPVSTSTLSLDLQKTFYNTASFLPSPADLDPNPRAVRLALLRAAVEDWQDRILRQRRKHDAITLASNSEQPSLRHFSRQFSELKIKLKALRAGYGARRAQLSGQAAHLIRETNRRSEELLALEKTLLHVSLEFAKAKKEAGGRRGSGIFGRFFG